MPSKFSTIRPRVEGEADPVLHVQCPEVSTTFAMLGQQPQGTMTNPGMKTRGLFLIIGIAYSLSAAPGAAAHSGLSLDSGVRPTGRPVASGFAMVGNVWEYMADEWRPYTSSARRNPVAGGDLFVEGIVFRRIKTRRVICSGNWGEAPVNL